jgi:hypothetical protein
MFTSRSKLFWAILALFVAVFLFLFPALIAYRYTAPSQRNDFVSHPWRGWSFAWAAITVPADSQLKTSGQALREAKRVFRGSSVDPQEIQLLFVPKQRPFTFTHDIAGQTITSTVTPSYRFIWQVTGKIDVTSTGPLVIVAMLDYASGATLYDVRTDLPGAAQPEPSPPAPAP